MDKSFIMVLSKFHHILSCQRIMSLNLGNNSMVYLGQYLTKNNTSGFTR